MNKGVLVGGGLGLLILLLLGGYWLTVRAPEPDAIVMPLASPASAPAEAPTSSPASTASGPSIQSNAASAAPEANSASIAETPSAPWQSPAATAAPQTSGPATTREERKKVRAEVRAKMSALLAKGANASPEDTLAFLSDVEKIGQGTFDPRYFSTLREMVRYSARTQELSLAFGKIANSKAPADEQKRIELLKEMRDLSDRFSSGAAALQTYAQDAASDKKP